jgi:hypothetical protein
LVVGTAEVPRMPVLHTSRVAIVVSPASRHRDLVEKTRAHARAEVPLYLVVGPCVAPAALILHSDLRGDAYQSGTHAEAGKTLAIPDPFGVELSVENLLA